MAFSLTYQSFPSPDGPLSFAHVPWDSELYGFPFYELRCADVAPAILEKHLNPWLTGLPANGACLVVAGLNPAAVATSRVLTQHGFYPVETILKIELPLTRFTPAVEKKFRYMLFRPAESGDLAALTTIARESFATDRLHLDPNLSPETAGERYARWLAGSFKAGEALFVMEDTRHRAITGFVLALKPDATTYDVTLAAIDQKRHNTGAGLFLYQAMLKESVTRGMRRVLASISINNLNSLKTAERLGFTVMSAATKFHWFRNKTLELACLLGLWFAGYAAAEAPANATGAPMTASSITTVVAKGAAAISSNSTNATAIFLDTHAQRYQTALAQARSWLDALQVNPTDLRAHGIKGKKKLTELLDVYLRLYEVAAPSDKPKLLERIRSITAMTATPGFHDMARVDDKQFKEDSTSYLRVAFLMDRFGLDTKLYRREIDKILPRLNDHMQYRGSDQRMAFHIYYKHFGLEEPFPLQAAYKIGTISARHDAGWFKQNPMETYSLTHEIFAPYEFGEKLDADFFSPQDKTYLRPLLSDLTAYSIGQDDPDITAELVSCLRYLRFTDLAIYRQAIEYLSKSQWPDGKWGNYEQRRIYYGDYVDQAFYLHTTMVTVDALITAFHFREK